MKGHFHSSSSNATDESERVLGVSMNACSQAWELKSCARRLRRFDICTSCSMSDDLWMNLGYTGHVISFEVFHDSDHLSFNTGQVVGGEKLLFHAQKNLSSIIINWLIIFPKCHVTKFYRVVKFNLAHPSKYTSQASRPLFQYLSFHISHGLSNVYLSVSSTSP